MKQKTCGRLKIFTGPMYSGKSSALIAEYECALEEGKKVLVIKPKIDTRYAALDIVSHDGISLFANTGQAARCLEVDEIVSVEELLQEGIELLLVDEAQFFTRLSRYMDQYLRAGIDVVAVGLDMDSDGMPFGCVPALLAQAYVVYKLVGCCKLCGEEATRTFRKLEAPSTKQVLIGGDDIYEARCMEHWLEGQEAKRRWLS